MGAKKHTIYRLYYISPDDCTPDSEMGSYATSTDIPPSEALLNILVGPDILWSDDSPATWLLKAGRKAVFTFSEWLYAEKLQKVISVEQTMFVGTLTELLDAYQLPDLWGIGTLAETEEHET